MLLGHLGGNAAWHPFPLPELASADWSAIFGQWGSIVTLLLLTAITFILNLSGIELNLRSDVDLNREMRIAGGVNIVSGLAGGVVGYPTLSLTSLSGQLGTKSRLTPVTAGLVAVFFLLVGAGVLTYLPKAIVGGLLMFLGADFLNEWLIQGIRKLNRTDYLIVLIIAVVVAIFGFLPGIGVGLLLTTGLFVLNYSRLNQFHRVATGAEVSSRVTRRPNERRLLAHEGRRVYLMELQGFIFFGTANTILDHIRDYVQVDSKDVRYLILDFARVTGLDSSTAFSFAKLYDLTRRRKITLIFTSLSAFARAELSRNGLIEGEFYLS